MCFLCGKDVLDHFAISSKSEGFLAKSPNARLIDTHTVKRGERKKEG
jgi:hypothetical protein